MRVSAQEMRAPVCLAEQSAAAEADPDADWARQTRRVLTRDLLLRASRAQPGESRALQFRALHLNLPLVGEVADRLALSAPERGRLEHAALDGLAQAIRDFDPTGPDEFADLACSLIERQVVAQRSVPHANARQLRQAIRRLMVAKARHRL
jgi:DNA-directed RNA polymerase specialized sigma subunit